MAEPPRRSTMDAAGQQVGEQQIQAAGGNITHYQLDPSLLRYLEGERSSRDAQAAAIVRLYEELAELRKERRRDADDAAKERGIDFEARLKRQAQLDAELARIRNWLALLSLLLLAVAVILAGLVWRAVGMVASAGGLP